MGATVIHTGPSPWDLAASSFQRAYEMGQQLYQQQQELAQRKVEAQSRMDLEAAERKKILTGIEQEEQNSHLSSQALSFVQGHLGAIQDPQRFGSATSGLDPQLFGRVFAIRDDFLNQQKAAVQLAETARQKSETSAAMAALPDAQRRAMQGIQGLVAAGIPGELAANLYAGVLPQAPMTPYQRAEIGLQGRQSIDALLAKGSTLGEARKILGIGPIAGMDDNYRLPLVSGTGVGWGSRAQAIAVHFGNMAYNGPLINRLVEDTGGLTDFAQAQRAISAMAATGSGISGFLASLGSQALNRFLDPKQQQLIAAQLQWANSYRFLISGAATTNQEFMTIMQTSLESVGDSEATKAQKRAFRQIVTDAAGMILSGTSRAQVTADVLSQARAMNMNPKLIAVLTKQAQDAAAFQAAGGNYPQQPLDNNPQNATADSVRALLESIP